MKSRVSRSKGDSRKTSRQENSKSSSATSSTSTPAKSDSTSSDSGSSLHSPSTMISNVSKTLQNNLDASIQRHQGASNASRSIQRAGGPGGSGTSGFNSGQGRAGQSMDQRVAGLEAKVEGCCS